MKNNDNEKSDQLAKKLRSLRAEFKYTQSYVAGELGITQQQYSKYESGASEPDVAMIRKLCDMYGITADDLIGKEEKPSVKGSKKNIKTMDFREAFQNEDFLNAFADFIKNSYKNN